MKCKTLLLLAALVVVFAVPAYAASVGNPIKPLGHLKYSVGVEEDMIFDKDLKKNGQTKTGATEYKIKSVDGLETNMTMGKATVGLLDYFNIYTKLGAAKLENVDVKFESTAADASIDTDYDFAWAIGGNAAYMFSDFEDIFVGTSLDYHRFSADIDSVTSSDNPTNLTGSVITDEIQLALYAGKTFEIAEAATVTPYIAGIYDHFKVKTDGAVKYKIGSNDYELNFDSKADDKWGIAVGAEVGVLSNINLNVEGRFIHETSLAFSGSYKF